MAKLSIILNLLSGYWVERTPLKEAAALKTLQFHLEQYHDPENVTKANTGLMSGHRGPSAVGSVLSEALLHWADLSHNSEELWKVRRLTYKAH